MDAAVLKTQLKSDIVSLFLSASEDDGISAKEYADQLAALIAQRVVTHIQSTAVVSTIVTGSSATGGAVTGTGTGSIT